MSPVAPNNTNLLLGAGQVFFDRADVDQGLVHLGNCTQFRIEFSDEKREVINRMTSTQGTYRKVTSKRTGTLTIVGQEFNPKNAALVTMGSISVLAQSGSTASNEILATALQAVKGAVYQTAYRKISALVMKQGATTLIEGDDYVITDATLGLITILVGGGQWTDGIQLDATSYSYAADTSTVIRGGDTGDIYGKVIFVGDPAAGPAVDIELWSVAIEPEGGLDLIGDDFLEWTLNAEIQDDSANHPDEPYFKLVDRGDYR